MTRVRRHLIAAAILVAFGAPPLRADTLNTAAAELRVKHYHNARSLVIEYYARGGARSYRADFIRAVSECRLYYKNSRLKALQVDYVLAGATAAEVNSWINSCNPPPPKKIAEGNANEEDSTYQMLETPPVVSAAAGPEPRPLPRMSPIIPRTGYIGDDYASLTLPSSDACRRVCQIQAPCRSITYDLNTKICWLKRSVPTVARADNFEASVKYPN